jgi:hypothetical protein
VTVDIERLPKRSCVISIEGWEVVGPDYSTPVYGVGRHWPQQVTPPHGSRSENRATDKEALSQGHGNAAHEGGVTGGEPCREVISLAQHGETGPMQPGRVNPA